MMTMITNTAWTTKVFLHIFDCEQYAQGPRNYFLFEILCSFVISVWICAAQFLNKFEDCQKAKFS